MKEYHIFNEIQNALPYSRKSPWSLSNRQGRDQQEMYILANDKHTQHFSSQILKDMEQLECPQMHQMIAVRGQRNISFAYSK
jgi:hypothetical protein